MRQRWRVSFLFACWFHTIAANLFSLSSPSITQDAVWLYSNSSSIAHTDKDIPAATYDDNVYPATNLTGPGKNGLRGILYDRSLSCDALPSDALPIPTTRRDIPRVALIKRGQCSFVQKLQLAQENGAAAAIVYDDDPQNTDAGDDTMLIPLGSGIQIPAYYVDHQIGVSLYSRLLSCSTTPSTTIANITTLLAVRVLILPSSSGGPNPWELTLMIVIALLAISFFASVGMHYHLWRKRRRQRRQLIEQGLTLPMAAQQGEPKEKPLVNEVKLGTFPKRVIKKRSHTRPRLSIPDDSEYGKDKAWEGTNDRASIRSSVSIPIEEPSSEACVICLDEWSEGDEVRKLPCRHEYHCMCIDPWLTSKSAECPLCKFNCASDPEDGDAKITQASTPLDTDTPLPSSTPSLPAQLPAPALSVSEPSRPEMARTHPAPIWLQRLGSTVPRIGRVFHRSRHDTLDLSRSAS